MKQLNRVLLLTLSLGLFVSLPMIGWTQDSPVQQIKTASGSYLAPGEGTGFSITNLLDKEKQTLFLTPQEGVELAKAIIRRGTEETYFYGKKITYMPGTEDFLIEGDARIEQQGNLLYGAKSIQFDSKKGTMIIEGYDKKRPARIYYQKFDDIKDLYVSAPKITFTFTKVKDDLKLDGFSAPKQYECILYEGDVKPDIELFRIISPPK